MQRIRLAVPALVAACALVLAGILAGTAAAAGPVWVVVPDAPAADASQPAGTSADQGGAAAQLQDTGLAAKLDDFLQAQGSPMAGAGASFASAGRQTGIDPRYLVALSGAESSFGKYLFRPFNPFGWGYATFSSWDEAIRTVARGLQNGYLSEGRTNVYSIATKYAPVGASNDPNGTNGEEPINVAKYLRELGGNPYDIRLGGDPLATAFGGGFSTVWGSSPGAQAASIALRFVGVPYVWGGDSPAGFDCSGLAMYAYGQVGITLSHWTGFQWNEGEAVDLTQLQPGDLLFFDMRNDVPQHEGMYVGGGLMVQAPHTGDIVRVVPLSAPGYSERFVKAVRPY